MLKVSVIIPTHNHGKYISRAIDSVLSQTYNDYEIIVVDDGSTDNTKEILKPYLDRIRYFYKGQGGDASARNSGIRKAKGEYFIFLDADDLLMPKNLEIHAKILDENQDIGFVYSYYYDMIDNKISHTTALNRKPPSGWIAKELFMESFIPIHTEMVRRECFEDSGLFDESLRHNSDDDVRIRRALKWKSYFSDYPSAIYRRDTSVQKKNVLEEAYMLEELNFVLRRILKEFPSFKNELGYDARIRINGLYCQTAKVYLEGGDVRKARINILNYIKGNLRNKITLLPLLLLTISSSKTVPFGVRNIEFFEKTTFRNLFRLGLKKLFFYNAVF